MQGGVEVAIKSIGFIETFGLAACVAAADAAVKSANVKLLGYEYAKGGGTVPTRFAGCNRTARFFVLVTVGQSYKNERNRRWTSWRNARRASAIPRRARR